jgi:hypothetical protein
VLRSCPAAIVTAVAARAADASTAAASGLRDPERDATLDDTSTNRNADPVNAPAAQTTHSSPDADTAATQNLLWPRLGAGPRAPRPAPAARPPPQLRRQRSPPAPAAAADNADFAPADPPAPAAWHANAGSPANDATAALPRGTPRCNNGSADARADTTAHSPSADNAAAGNGIGPVELASTRRDTEVGPREQSTPWVKSRRRAANSTPRRFLVGTSRSSIASAAKGCQEKTWPPQRTATEWRSKFGRPTPGRDCHVAGRPIPGRRTGLCGDRC